MSADYKTLWKRLLGHFEKRGYLPLRYQVMTPAEIAESVYAARGDDRARHFVLGYYYPHFYGQEEGTLSDEDAEALVASFEEHSQPPPDRSMAHVKRRRGSVKAAHVAKRLSCEICGLRAARGNVH